MKRPPLFLMTLFVLAGMVLTACSGGGSEAYIGSWKLISYGASSNPTPAVPETDTSLTFHKDGKVSGNVGCNSFGGDYKISGDTITFGAISSTLMACADPLMEQESAVFNVLEGTTSFNIDGNTLIITSTDADSIVLLERK